MLLKHKESQSKKRGKLGNDIDLSLGGGTKEELIPKGNGDLVSQKHVGAIGLVVLQSAEILGLIICFAIHFLFFCIEYYP